MSNPFYAYCVGIGTGKESATLEAQLEMVPMLSQLGYAGMAYVGLNGATEMLDALEKSGLKLLAVYTPLTVDEGGCRLRPSTQGTYPEAEGPRNHRLARSQQPNVQAVVDRGRREGGGPVA